MIKLSVLIPVWNQEELVIKALDHLPRRDDMEIIVRDDGSTDNTLANLKQYKEEHPELNLTITANKGNKGVAYTKNRLLKAAKGEFIHLHDSDDYVITADYNRMVGEWLYNCSTADIIIMDLQTNEGRLVINRDNYRIWCAQISRFIRREFAQGITFPEEIRAGDDWYYAEDLVKRNPNQIFTGVMAYHYNFPREGSLTNLKSKGLI
jgi:glycosyltransferase involved in cell wall biosynthesis